MSRRIEDIRERGADAPRSFPSIARDLLRHPDRAAAVKVLDELVDRFAGTHGVRAADALLKRLQVSLGHRRMSIGIYDHALHAVGGGQKYVATMAAALQDRFDVTYLVNREVDLAEVGGWYDLDLSRCGVRVVPLDFYRGRQWIDSGLVTAGMENPFDEVARASGDYDLFVNANMLEKVRPLAPLSVFVCHFPDSLPRAHFAAHEYTFLLANSRYTSGWVRRRWGLSPTLLLYPPIDMQAARLPKERIILAAARFEPGGTKKQLELVQAFRALSETAPESLSGWRLVLVGGSLAGNPYLERVRRAAAGSAGGIEVRANAPFQELSSWYARASIFWHACGLGERDPQLIEHFGMTVVEAMQNRCVPVVFDGGGLREIVETAKTGFRFGAFDELCASTLRLVRDRDLRESMQEAAWQRSRRFGRAAFEARVHALFDLAQGEYVKMPPPDPD